MIYLNDHEPMHVHVFHQNGEAVINFAGAPLLRENRGLNRNHLWRAMSIMQENQAVLQSRWREINE
jgi:hypothetical protein